MKKKACLKAIAGIVCAVLAAAGAAWAAGYADEQLRKQECAMLQEQVRRAAVDCYASEGRYPQTIDYLVKHYGLVFDGERYSILYDAFASNIMPDIAVSIRGEDVP